MAWISAIIAIVLALIQSCCKKNDETNPQDDANAEETSGIMAGMWDGISDLGGSISEWLSDDEGNLNVPATYGATVGLTALIDPEDAADTTEDVKIGRAHV